MPPVNICWTDRLPGMFPCMTANIFCHISSFIRFPKMDCLLFLSFDNLCSTLGLVLLGSQKISSPLLTWWISLFMSFFGRLLFFPLSLCFVTNRQYCTVTVVVVCCLTICRSAWCLLCNDTVMVIFVIVSFGSKLVKMVWADYAVQAQCRNLSGKWAHMQFVREHFSTVISTHWATVDWLWPKGWNWCAWADLY